jgi:hypothetical protein
MADVSLQKEFSIPDLYRDFVSLSGGRGPLAREIRETLWKAVNLLAEQIVVRTPSNTGNLSGAISQAKQVQYGRGVWEASVTDGGVPYGLPVNYGRKPGRRPPVDDIEYWVKRKKIQWMIDRKNKPPRPATTREMAWAIAVSIAMHGTFKSGTYHDDGSFAHPGPPMMFERGMEAAEPYIDDLFAELLDRIANHWQNQGYIGG